MYNVFAVLKNSLAHFITPYKTTVNKVTFSCTLKDSILKDSFVFSAHKVLASL